jgi:hypothetical protein
MENMMDRTRFIKITDEKGDRIMLNIDMIYRIQHYKAGATYQIVFANETNERSRIITKEQFEEFWG